MVSERIQRRIDALLDEADSAFAAREWARLRELCDGVLRLEPDNEDAMHFIAAADRDTGFASQAAGETAPTASATGLAQPALPTSFASGRYRVLRLLGEGARKRVYLAHDERLDRDVAFAVIRTEGLDAMGRERVQREARAMARIGAHPNLVAIHDIGEEGSDAYFVQEFMDGGDLAVGPEPLAVARVLEVAKDITSALAFIHRAGIVHRDLKPANVFLAKDGTAKVGDFGLAMAADLSRITQHGTFVGTVAYMPPEQAVGGEVTAKSDLYSFGALLYEVLTGRPPFVGDDPTAIISQHLNTPPVAPSWHREDCPPGLERVILRLLEKDPAKRPADANEVLALLEKVDPEERPAPRSEGHVLERLARGVFVGREKELERLRKGFDEALSGRGGLVMLVGEPGIGKTRTAQELETYARMRGAQVLWGRSHENSGAPAFWPWVQVGRHWGSTNDVSSLSSFLAAGGGDLARLFPELRGVAGFVEPPVMQDGAAAQFRLFDAFASFERTISETKPTVITLDDLHWADKPTLQLLQHLARELSRMRVLVVCTYRDTDLVRTHPLSEALANLNRDPGFERVVLRGLSKDETRAYIASAASLQPSSALVERVYEETEGNPFFLSEVVNLLTQEGTLASESVSDIHIPDGVREALGRRLDRISEEATSLLQVAAVVGREFTYDTLQLLHSGDDDALLKLIEEGLEARVIEEMEQPGRYRFTHALMQETLLGELSTTRRVRLHGQVGEALERRWGDRAEEYASRLANHFLESSSLTSAHAHKAGGYLRLAAQQAESRFAWIAAATQYDRVVELARESGSPLEPVDEADLLVSMARCYSGSLEPRSAWRSIRRALALYEECQESARYARTVAVAMTFPSAMLPPAERRVPMLDLAIQQADSDDERTLAALYLARAETAFYLGEYDQADRFLSQPERAAPRLESTFLRAEALRIRALLAVVAGDVESSLDLYEGAVAAHAAGGNPARAAETLYLLAQNFQGEGQLEQWRRTLLRQDEAGATAGLTFFQEDARSKLFGCAVLRGDHAEADRYLALPWEPSVWTWGIFAAYRAVLIGDLQAMERHLPDPAVAGGIPWQQCHILYARADVLALAKRRDGATAELVNMKRLLPSVEGFTRPPMSFGHSYLEMIITGSPPSAETVAAAVAPKNWIVTVLMWASHLTRMRAEVLMAAGELRLARALLEEALGWCARERCKAEAGRCHLAFADLEAREGNAPATLTHLDMAAGFFRDYGAAFLVEKAIARKVEIQGLSGSDPFTSIVAVSTAVGRERPDVSLHAATDGTVTLMFSDIEGSTALNERLGDGRWMEVLRAHNDLVDREVAAHGGRTVKTIGDGYMVAFPSPEAGVRCALAIQAALTPDPSPRGEGRPSHSLLDGI
ncbi:MAG: protein kinase, partial [Dehalococcoidia bacterium]